VFHVLNRGNGRQTLFFGSADYEAFVRVVKDALLIVPMRILRYCLITNHWHFVRWPAWDDPLSAFMHQLLTTHVRRWQKAHHCEGEGHVYQGRCKSFPVEDDEHLHTMCRYVERHAVRARLVERAEDWVRSSVRARLHPKDPRALPLADWPIPRPADWSDRVNQALTGAELEALRRCAERGSPYGSGSWVEQTARHLGLEATLRTRGRPPKTR
jgi:putative transposase